MSNLRYIAVCGAILAAISLPAAVTVWHGHKTGVVALVVAPRHYVPVVPGATQEFTAVAWWGDGNQATVSTAGAAWQCSQSIGTMASSSLLATNATPSFGWVEGCYSGITKRVFVKVTNDGFWNPDADADGDGLSDAAELLTNSPPDRIQFINIRCRVK